MEHTPGPWEVVMTRSAHLVGGGYCREQCERNEVITATRPATETELRMWSVPSGEVHETRSTRVVEDVIAASGDHVVCCGHDYGDMGNIGIDDARLIAAAPDLLALLVRLSQWDMLYIPPDGSEPVMAVADGPYWRREIDSTIARARGAEAPAVGTPTP